MKYVCLAAILVLACLPRGIDAAQIRPAVPVMIGGQEASEGCVGTATVVVRAGALNLRAGPGLNHPVIARLTDGQRVSICQRRDGWVGILVLRDGPGPRDCQASDAGPKRKPYEGPCSSGWIAAKYVRILAG
jgi:uncharacterized protein YgiM (DUF1202 family)